MACLTPIPAVQDGDGCVTLKESYRLALLEPGKYLELSCGRCGACRASRTREWAIRAHHESLMHTRPVNNLEVQNGAFITLTYNEEHLPDDGSLDKEHWQLFRKRLRERLGHSFRFLHCGEYGSLRGRPHYHACIFGADFHGDREPFKRDGTNIVWTSKLLADTWGKGFCTTAPLNYQSAAYVAGYIFKKLRTADHEEKFGRLVVENRRVVVRAKQPEYITMSNRPGLGTTWFERFWTDVYPEDRVTLNGKEFRPPKFYDKLLELHRPDVWEQVKEQRRAYYDSLGPTPEDQLAARAAIFDARFKQRRERKDL